jgi:hypothetical protein
MSDAITRLQRERDLALRRIDELYVHYKKELKSKAEFDADESPQMRSVRCECEKRVNQSSVSRVIIGVDPGVNTSSALPSVSDAIDPASCPVATREYSVRAEADEADISRRAEAAETVILVTTSRNRLGLEGKRVVLRGTLTTDILTLFRIYKCKKKAILASLSHLMRLDSLFSYMDMIATANNCILT